MEIESKKDVFFVGLLANVDSSILKMKFEHGFAIDFTLANEGIYFFSSLENIPFMEMAIKLSPCINSENRIYYIENSIEDIEIKKGMPNLSSPIMINFGNLFLDYLVNLLQKMRLFKQGNICIPWIYYYFENDELKLLMRQGPFFHTAKELYTLNTKEIADLNKFIKNIKIPFKYSYLQLAFENFELSYNVENIDLSFLTLMMCLETLYHRGHGELTYRISRNTAVLLGRNSKTIFSETKRLYGLRSTLLHIGKRNIIKKEDLLLLRYYVRESIKEIYRLDKGKDELLEFLNSCGFDRKEFF